MKILKAPLMVLDPQKQSFIGMVLSDRHELAEFVTRESAECALQDFVKRSGRLCSSHIKYRTVGVVKSFERCSTWGRNVNTNEWEFHNGWCVTGEILGYSNYPIWKNIVNGYFRGLSIGGYREGSYLRINEVSLVDTPGYLCSSSSGAGGGE